VQFIGRELGNRSTSQWGYRRNLRKRERKNNTFPFIEMANACVEVAREDAAADRARRNRREQEQEAKVAAARDVDGMIGGFTFAHEPHLERNDDHDIPTYRITLDGLSRDEAISVLARLSKKGGAPV